MAYMLELIERYIYKIKKSDQGQLTVKGSWNRGSIRFEEDFTATALDPKNLIIF